MMTNARKRGNSPQPISVSGMMLAIAGAAVVYLSVTFLDETSATTTRRKIDREPESTPSTDGSDRVPTTTTTDA